MSDKEKEYRKYEDLANVIMNPSGEMKERQQKWHDHAMLTNMVTGKVSLLIGWIVQYYEEANESCKIQELPEITMKQFEQATESLISQLIERASDEMMETLRTYID